MFPRHRRPTPPGRILKEEFLLPLRMTRKRLADHLGCDVKVVHSLVNGRCPVTAGVAIRLGAAFGTSPDFWRNMQKACDLHDAAKSVGPPTRRRDSMPKMKAYATFDLYLADRPPAHRAIIGALRRLVRSTAPALVESVKWGNGCWLAGPAPIAYVYSDADHVQFGFLRGASLRDPKGLLQGQGAYVRHVKVRRAGDIDRAAFAALLRQAVRLGGVPGTYRRERGGKPARPKSSSRKTVPSTGLKRYGATGRKPRER